MDRHCNKCLALDLTDSDFYESCSTVCKACYKAAVRQRYADNRELYQQRERGRIRPEGYVRERTRIYRSRHPEKDRARRILNQTITRGKIKRQPCGLCGSTQRVQAHHTDYSKSLDVLWRCFTCHRREEHGQQPSV